MVYPSPIALTALLCTNPTHAAYNCLYSSVPVASPEQKGQIGDGSGQTGSPGGCWL